MTESRSAQFIRFACKHCGKMFTRVPYELIAQCCAAKCSACGGRFTLDREELQAALIEAMDNESHDAGDSLDIEKDLELDAGDSLDIEEDLELDAGDSLDIEEDLELDAGDSLDIEEDLKLGAEDSPDQVPGAPQQPARPRTGFEPEKENKVEFARRLSRLIPEGWVNPSLDQGTATPSESAPVDSIIPDMQHVKDHRQFLVFALGETECAVPVENTTEISMVPELTRLPHVPDWLLGIINLRGDIVSVIDMKNFLGMGSFDFGTSDRIILLRSLQEDLCTAIIVNRIVGMQYVDEKDLILNEAGEHNAEQHILGIFEIDERSIVVLDIDNLLASDDMQQFRAL